MQRIKVVLKPPVSLKMGTTNLFIQFNLLESLARIKDVE